MFTRVLAIAAGAVALLVVGVLIAIWAVTYHPDPLEDVPVRCSDRVPMLDPGRAVKVLNWNVQFLAGKGYTFFFDILDGSGPDERPSPAAIAHTLDEVARVIEAEQPDLVLLQEVDDGAARTDGQDQLALLLDRLAPAYACHASAFYWKAGYVPHPRIRGAAGMKLSIISKFKIEKATRRSLPGTEGANLVEAQFTLRRAVLEAWLPVAGGGPSLVLLDTHLAAFAQGSDTMQRQVRHLHDRMAELDAQGHPWLLGGDLNLLPPGEAYRELPPGFQVYYQPDTELAQLYDRWPAVPARSQVTGPDRATWFTHFPNDPRAKEPDRTIDYLFHSRRLVPVDAHVRREDTLKISDHLPLVASFRHTGGGPKRRRAGGVHPCMPIRLGNIPLRASSWSRQDRDRAPERATAQARVRAIFS